MLHSGRVAFGEMDELVFGRPAPTWSWPPEGGRKHVGGCYSQAPVLGLPMTLREGSRHPDPPVFAGKLQALTFPP